MLAASLMLGGSLPLDQRTREHWAASGAFRMPVGDPYQVYETGSRPRSPGPFFIQRGVAWEGERAAHQGVDLASGSAGALIHAASSGVVVQVADHGWNGGYGTFAVLAHRLPEGVLAYTVYGHMREGSPRVRMGQCVQSGQVLGRVGATGHVTGPHLHFEVRLAGDPEERWEFARVEDPLAFVDSRLPTHRADTTGVEACLEWAECASLVSPGARAEDALTREAWWRMLAAGVRGPALDPSLSPLDLRDSLLAARLLAEDGQPGETTLGGLVEWPEVARDLGRARRRGTRAGTSPLRRTFLRETCAELLGEARPAANLGAFAGRSGRPTLGEAVVMFADLAGPSPEPVRATPVRKPLALPGGAIAGAVGPTRSTARADPARANPKLHRDSLAVGGRPVTTRTRTRADSPHAPSSPTASRTRARADSSRASAAPTASRTRARADSSRALAAPAASRTRARTDSSRTSAAPAARPAPSGAGAPPAPKTAPASADSTG
jgi:murein DD-endopeptidase MepM/ murein hydrolase activator NlpD